MCYGLLFPSCQNFAHAQKMQLLMSLTRILDLISDSCIASVFDAQNKNVTLQLRHTPTPSTQQSLAAHCALNLTSRRREEKESEGRKMQSTQQRRPHARVGLVSFVVIFGEGWRCVLHSAAGAGVVFSGGSMLSDLNEFGVGRGR